MKIHITDYKKLKNRCYECGHRLDMKKGGICTVVNGIPNPQSEVPCRCRK